VGTPFESGFKGCVAVVTGGGSGMGRELVRQLTADGCDVATCDVDAGNLTETADQCLLNDGAVTTFIADVSDESQILAFRDHVADWRPHVNLLFNNAGIGGGGSIVEGSREEWEKTFGVCFYGVYYGTRAFLPLLMDAPYGHVINTSSVNGLWASLGPDVAHTAYSTAKFAVRGFTEALITDFRLHAPHIGASVVMPGHIGTGIVANSNRILGHDPKDMDDEQLGDVRRRLSARYGPGVDAASDEDLRVMLQAQAEGFRDNAPMSAAEAATVMLEGVRAGEWRILVGADAKLLDEEIRKNPTSAYDIDFMAKLQARGAFDRMMGRARST
jgi:NAD(P)-dependent dehydrogenase (short-subunit alcohol dehydrogenase family)